MTPDLETDFRAFAAAPADTIAGALLVSRLVEPATDPDWCVGELRQLASGVVDPRAPVALVDHLRGLGFAGATQYYEPANSALQRVLETHRGIPISLAMVLLGVARELGLPAAGINFPGHFLVEIADTLVDPFSMSVLDAQERAQRLAACGVPADLALKPASPRDIVLRMLNNLRGIAVARGDHHGALEFTDYQLLLAPDAFAIRLARVESWEALGVRSMARHELAHAISLAPTSRLKTDLEEALGALPADGPTLH